MSVVQEKKLKQARLDFSEIPAVKKRKCDEVDNSENKLQKLDSTINVEFEIPTTKKFHLDAEVIVIDDTGEGNMNIENNDSLRTTTVQDLYEASCEPYQMENMDIDLSISSSSVNKFKTNEKEECSDMIDLIEDPIDIQESCSATEAEKDERKSLTPSPINDKTFPGPMIRKLTPKQLQKKAEVEMRKQERKKLKQEKERKRQEEKDVKEKKRLAETEAKNEEKRQKEEERKAREEERRIQREDRKAKEEKKKLKLEQERQKKEKIAAAFTSFFVPKSKINQNKTTEITVTSGCNNFMPFEPKENMRIADSIRTVLTSERKAVLDQILQNEPEQSVLSLYLNLIKSNDYKLGHSDNTWPLNVNDEDDDVKSDFPVDRVRTRYRCKLLQFTENRRPAYWGTWRNRSKCVTGRKPFACDTKYFEYDIDSDDEWVEEEPGESLHGSDDEKESDHEYEVDNDFFVPHGYLSDEEGQEEDETDKSPKKKLKLNILRKEFEAELKEKTYKLKARHYGCLWIRNDIEDSDDNVEALLLSFRAVYNEDQTPFRVKSETENITAKEITPVKKIRPQNEFPEQYLSDLISLVHGNKHSSKNLASEFVAYLLEKNSELNISTSSIRRKLKEIAYWNQNLCCWLVNNETKIQHKLDDLSHTDNSWTYVSTVCQTRIASKKDQKMNTEKLVQSPTSSTSKHISITKFAKVLTPEEKERQLRTATPRRKIDLSPSTNTKFSPNTPETPRRQCIKLDEKTKKRAVLFTLKKGVEWAQSSGASSNPCSPITREVSNPIMKAILENTSKLANNNNQINTGGMVTNSDSGAEENLTEGSKNNDVSSVIINKNNTKMTIESSMTVKQGKKYANLITIAKGKNELDSV